MIENAPPPIVDSPKAEPESAARMLWAWWVLAFVTLIMVADQLVDYFGPDNNPTYSSEQTLVRQSHKGVNVKESLVDAVRDLSLKKDSDIAASRIFVVARFEADREPIPVERQGKIAKATSGWDQAKSKLYASEKLTPESAKTYRAKIPDDEPLKDVVESHIAMMAGEKSKKWSEASKASDVILLIGAGLMVGVFTGLGIWVWYFQMRSMGKWEPLGPPNHPVSGLEADTYALRAAVIIMAVGPLSPASFLPGPAAFIGTIGLSAVAYFLPIAGFRLRRGFFGPIKPLTAFGVAFGTYLAALPLLFIGLLVAVVLQKFLPESTHPLTTELAKDPSQIFAAILSAVIMAPLLEETIFRGVLFPGLHRLLKSPLTAGIVSSVVFAIIHPQGIPAWPALAIVGGAAAFAAYQTRSIWPCIILHACHNGMLLVLAVSM